MVGYAQPLPRIDDTLDTIGDCCYFSTLDLASRYWQTEVSPDDREKTAFSMPYALWFIPIPGHAFWPVYCTSHLSAINGGGLSWIALE